MEIETYQLIFFYIVLPLLGIGLIVFALVRGRRLGQRPVEISAAKLGLSLKSDTLTLLIILGCILACVGVFVWSRGYEAHVKGLKDKLQTVEAEKNNLYDVLDRLRVYAMRFNLVFPHEDTVNVKEFEVQVYKVKQGEVEPKLYTPKPLVGLMDDIWVNIDNLIPGDKLRIVAYEGGDKSWESSDIEIPKSQIHMRRIR